MTIALTRATGGEGTSTENTNKDRVAATGPEYPLLTCLPCLYALEMLPAPSAPWAGPSMEDSTDCGETNHTPGARATLGQWGVSRVSFTQVMAAGLGP